MSAWLRPLRADARVRLFCLPYAGGGAADYVRWRPHLPPDVEVAPLLLPGRGSRLAEAPYRRFEPLVDAIADALAPALDRPWALYGHSLGAAVAFAVASTLVGAGARPPVHLFFGGRGGPGGPRRGTPISELPEDAFLDAIQTRYEPLPAVLLADRPLLSVFLEALRADMAIAEAAAPELYAPVPVPATVFIGEGDTWASPADARRWAAWVGEPFAVEILPGGHFFVRAPDPRLYAGLAAALGSGTLP